MGVDLRVVESEDTPCRVLLLVTDTLRSEEELE